MTVKYKSVKFLISNISNSLVWRRNIGSTLESINMLGTKKSKEMWREIKWRLFGKTQYGEHWKPENIDWYENIHKSNHLIHEDFKQYLKSKNDIKTILEIGCGAGIYPINIKKYFLIYIILESISQTRQ